MRSSGPALTTFDEDYVVSGYEPSGHYVTQKDPFFLTRYFITYFQEKNRKT